MWWFMFSGKAEALELIFIILCTNIVCIGLTPKHIKLDGHLVEETQKNGQYGDETCYTVGSVNGSIVPKSSLDVVAL